MGEAEISGGVAGRFAGGDCEEELVSKTGSVIEAAIPTSLVNGAADSAEETGDKTVPFKECSDAISSTVTSAALASPVAVVTVHEWENLGEISV